MSLLGFRSLVLVGLCVLAEGRIARADIDSHSVPTVRFLSSMPGHLDWRGRGDVSLQHTFCVESATGHFVLDVASMTGGLNGQTIIPYEVTIEINGRVQTGVISRNSPIFSFRGETSRSSNCLVPSNVGVLTVRLLQKDAMGAVSGSYADQLSVSVASN
ncbi:hypothetical protein [Hyphomonas sp.]|jgi:hypothetical protein|uniref:hypothetical protein n=1 Tax=Hyphomonas sp. TaxID=87 RepID=UPI0030030BA1